MFQMELAPELEARLHAAAQASGLSLELYAVRTLEQAVPSCITSSEEGSTPEQRAEGMRQFIAEMARFSHKIPSGIYEQETFGREFIYGDHP